MTPPTLRSYQFDAVEAVFREWESVASTMIVMATGLGKTVTFCEIVRRLHPKRSIIIAHRNELIHQAVGALEKIGLRAEIEMGDTKADASMFFGDSTIVASVQSLNSGKKDDKRMKKFRPEDFSLLVIDEFHHSVSPSYRAVIDHFRQNPNLKVLGVTATPDRLDEKALGLICDSVAFKYDIADAVEHGYLVPIEQQMVHIKSLDFSKVRTTAGDLNGGDLAAVMEDEKNLLGMVGASIEIIGRRSSIAFTSSVRHAEMCCDIFNRYRPGMAAWISGTTPEDDRRSILKKFKEGEIQVLTNVGIATEGFDAPNAECVIMGRPTKSRALYTQCLDTKTEILTRRGWMGCDDIKSSDSVLSFDMAEECVAWSPVLEKFDRMSGPDEVFVSVNSPYFHFRVTGGHNVLVRQIRGREEGKSPWKLIPAINWASSSHDHCFALSSTHRDRGIGGGLPISEWDLKFIGLVMTDGTIGQQKQITITQSERQPWIHEIDEIIEHCGFQCTKTLKDRRGEGFETEFKTFIWTISFGSPRRVKTDKTGWGRLAPYMDKSLALPLMECNRSQVGHLLYGLHLGDGQKQLNQDWVRRSYHICTRRKIVADRLQALCVQSGFKCNIGTVLRDSGPFYTVHIKDQQSIVISGSSNKDRTKATVEPPSRERVWCVSTIYKTIVTRRNGKVAILGNCIGRITRPLPGVLDGMHSAFERCDAIACSPKPSALVLDFVGNSGKHKLMTTADVLGGNYDEEVRDMAVLDASKSGGAVRMADALKKAQKAIIDRIEAQKRAEAARRAKLIAEVKFSTRNISPFDVFQITPKKDSSWDRGRPLSEGQKNVLRKMGVNPDELNYAAAKQLLHKHFERREKGLCTYAQAKCLLKNGWTQDEVKKMQFTDASRAIESLKNNGWKRVDQFQFA